jgi:hypothetical protein
MRFEIITEGAREGITEGAQPFAHVQVRSGADAREGEEEVI